jgi:hypothetical protein
MRYVDIVRDGGLLVNWREIGFHGLFGTYWFALFGGMSSRKFSQLFLTTTPTVPCQLLSTGGGRGVGGKVLPVIEVSVSLS